MTLCLRTWSSGFAVGNFDKALFVNQPVAADALCWQSPILDECQYPSRGDAKPLGCLHRRQHGLSGHLCGDVGGWVDVLMRAALGTFAASVQRVLQRAVAIATPQQRLSIDPVLVVVEDVILDLHRVLRFPSAFRLTCDNYTPYGIVCQACSARRLD